VNLLAIETSARVATAALLRDGVCALELEADAEKRHAESFPLLIERLLLEADTPLEAIDLFAADVGPGSFTGVRIGVSLINAMAFALQRKIVPVDALLALYTAANEPVRPVCAMLDARNGNAYAALYEAGRALAAPAAVEIESFLPSLPPGTRLVGDVRTDEVSLPRASAVGKAAYGMTAFAAPSVEPLYLRPPQAERMRMQRERETKP